MYIRAPTPKTRLSLTPNNVKPIQFDIRNDITPTRVQNVSFYDPHQISVISMEPSMGSLNLNGLTGRLDERGSYNVRNQPVKVGAPISQFPEQGSSQNNRLNYVKSEKENLVRVAGNSFCGKEPSARELQLQISELKKQKENICFTLAEALKKNSLLKTQLDSLALEKDEQARQYQQNLDLFYNELNMMNEKVTCLQLENQKLQEQSENQQWYIEQLESQQSFNQTQNFGSG